ncbi:unnamed protein product [Rotaria sordida]|uniref:Protein-tyrosine-phosphatase n=1 Tax=Rotaria sordida TaxID=392033 RepID=A0A815VWV7_9BILA|nr:unnamed protein product [Rotaria sordida]CAF1538351.1 unnamed protein product [Rotaria sordida]
MKLLEELGIQHIINVSHIRLDKDIVDKYNVLWINLKDNFRENIQQHFDRTNEFLQTCKNKNEKVLIHCQSGISRSTSVILAYLLRYHHDTLHNAYGYLLERRCMARPNDGFLLQLIRYEKELQIRKTVDVEQSLNKSVDTDLISSIVDENENGTRELVIPSV